MTIWLFFYLLLVLVYSIYLFFNPYLRQQTLESTFCVALYLLPHPMDLWDKRTSYYLWYPHYMLCTWMNWSLNLYKKEIYTFNHSEERFPAFSTWAIHANEHLKCHQHARVKVVLSALSIKLSVCKPHRTPVL